MFGVHKRHGDSSVSRFSFLAKPVMDVLLRSWWRISTGCRKIVLRWKSTSTTEKEATLMAHSVASDAVSVRHRFADPKGDAFAVLAATKLTDDSWGPSQPCSIDVSELVSTSPTIPW